MIGMRLNNYPLLHIHKNLSDTLDLVSVAKKIISNNERETFFFLFFDSFSW